MTDLDYYEILGVNHDATIDEIKSAFRGLAKSHHPDRGGNPLFFRLIEEAYDTLKDPQRRRQYDLHGTRPAQPTYRPPPRPRPDSPSGNRTTGGQQQPRCRGTNPDGTPCADRPIAGKTYCYRHLPQSNEMRDWARRLESPGRYCTRRQTDGSLCTNRASMRSDRCWVHGGQSMALGGAAVFVCVSVGIISVAAFDDTYRDAADQLYTSGEWSRAVLTTAAPALILAIPFPRLTGVMALAATIGAAAAAIITAASGRGDYVTGWVALSLCAAITTVLCYLVARARGLIVPPNSAKSPGS